MSRPRRTFFRWAPVMLFLIAFGVFLVLYFRYQRQPVIVDLDRNMAASGDSLEITGRFFGDGLDGSKLFIGPHSLPSTGILEWENNRILARVPRNDGAVLVRVKTRSGTSNGVTLGDATRFPLVEYGPWLPGASFIEYVEPPSGGPGTLVSLHGDGFGNQRGGGRIWVNRSDFSSFWGTEEPDLDLYIEADLIAHWSDTLVKFWIPEGVSSGNIYLQTGGRFSNPVSIDLSGVPGTILKGARTRWSLRQEIAIHQVSAFPENSLYIHVPTPPLGIGQGPPAILDTVLPQGMKVLQYQSQGTLFRLDNLEPGKAELVSRQLVLDTWPVEINVEPSKLIPYDSSRPDIAQALAEDSWIQPNAVTFVAARAVGPFKDDWSKSQAIFNYVVNTLSWSDSPPSREISEYIKTREADSEGYAFLFCSLARAAKIPARPVGGIIVLEDGYSRGWWWAEIWIEGLGWVPVDPALADEGGNIVLPGRETLGSRGYFGGLEGRHIAFSRGVLPSHPVQPDPNLRTPDEYYTLQNSWEEASGNLDTYTSRWIIPKVTAFYSMSE